MKKLFIAALLCLGAFTKGSAQSMTIINKSATGIGVNIGASDGACTSGCCSAINSSMIQIKAGGTVKYNDINDLCARGNVWLGSGCPTSFKAAGSHWDMAKVIIACGIAKVGSGCDPMVKPTATMCTGSTVTWTSTGGNVTVTIN